MLKTFTEYINETNHSLLETPSKLPFQVFLMNFPLNMKTSVANNPWMQELSNKERKINYTKAFEQFLLLYKKIIAAGALIYLLPNKGHFQDQEYTANLGIYLPHIKNEDTIIIAKFKSPPRKGEDKVGKEFFEMMRYKVFQPTTTWEGEAELKFVRDNLYVGGYGSRTDIASYKWMQSKFNMNIITMEMKDKMLYHFDTMFLRLSPQKVMIVTSAINKNELRELEKHVEVLDIPKDIADSGVTNAICIDKTFFCGDPGHMAFKSDKGVKVVKHRKDYMDKAAESVGCKTEYINVEEYQKSGADLGCLFMHLNYK